MKNDNKYHLYVDGQKIPVSKEIYDAYWHYTNKEDYFMRLMKENRSIHDPETGEKIRIPSIEESYDQLVEEYVQFAVSAPSVEEQVIIPVWLDKLLCKLEPKEQLIIRRIFFEQQTERELSAELHVSQNTVNYWKNKALKKLRKILEKNS